MASSAKTVKPNVQVRKNANQKLWLKPYAVRLCQAYTKNPIDFPCSSNCTKLHVCRRWLAGCCREIDCKWSHSLTTPINLKVLRFAGIHESCQDELRRVLSKVFPSVCFHYNLDTGCAYEFCSRLHLCRHLVLNGFCANQKQCSRIHAPSNEQLRPVWEKFKVTWKTQEDILAIYKDCIVSDAPRFDPQCKCALCSSNSGMRQDISATASENEEESNQNQSCSSMNDLRSEADASECGSTSSWMVASRSKKMGAAVAIKKPVQPIAAPAAGAIDCFEKLNIRDAIRRGFDNGTVENDSASLMTFLVAYLIDSGLVVPSEQAVKLFHVSGMPTFVKALRFASVFEPTFRAKLPITFEWNGTHFIGMLCVFRICTALHSPTGCRDPKCSYIHLCKLFVAGACQKGAACGFSHDVLKERLFSQLGCESYSAERRLALIRMSHPTVCESYAYSPTGCSDANCVNMHVCNEVVLGVRCRTPTCVSSKDHSPASSRFCKVRLTRFGLASESAAVVMSNFLPVAPPSELKSMPIQSSAKSQPKTKQTITPVQAQAPAACRISSSASENSHSENESVGSVSNSFAQQLAQVFSSSEITFQTLTLPILVKFLMRNQLESTCDVLFRTFRMPFTNDTATNLNIDREMEMEMAMETQLEKWLHTQRRLSALKASVRYRLPMVLNRFGVCYISMLRMFRLCKLARFCTDRKCSYLHVCKFFVVGMCKSERDATDCLHGAHSHGLLNAPLFHMLGLQHLSLEQRQSLICASHPQVCAAYAFATCENGQCSSIHCCNDLILGQCRSTSCNRSHDLSPDAANCRNLTRFGLASTKQDIVAQLMLPTKPPPIPADSSSVPPFHLSAHTVVQPARTRDVPVQVLQPVPNQASSFSMNSIANVLPISVSLVPVGSDFTKLRETVKQMPSPILAVAATSSNVEFASKTTAQPAVAQVPAKHTVSDVSQPTSNTIFTVCELYLRGLCDNGAPIHEGLIHCDQPFCWVYKLPRSDEAISYMKRMLPDARHYKASDGSCWVLFAEKDNIMMETGYCTPQVRMLNRTVELSEPYPFAGDSEIMFGNVRDETSFRMVTRLKQLSSAGVGQKVAANFGSKKESDEPVFRLSKQIEMEVRCFRTPSFCFMIPNCTRATKWRWLYKNRDVSGSEETWIDSSELVGDNATEIEYAYVSGQKSVVLPSKEYCRPGGEANVHKRYVFDFETLLVTCDDDGLQTDLCSRPGALATIDPLI